jgi:CheY-like chemotaxis protein
VNLVSNAIRVMSRGTVVIQASYGYVDGQGWLTVAVIDDGPGIRAELQKVMFERFSRLSEAGGGSAISGSTGWGLGLSICASLVDLMGGRISVESEYGHGATFRVDVPMSREETPASSAEPEPAYTATIRKDFSILIVDDMPMNRLVLAKMLESLGCRVTLAESGVQALKCVASLRFDLILMDVDMAEMDGMEATRRIRAMTSGYADVPIVAVTGFASPEQVARIMASGMNDHALKPLRKTTAAQLLARWVPNATSAAVDPMRC